MSGPPEPGGQASRRPPSALRQRLLAAAGPFLGLVLLGLAAWILRHEILSYSFGDVLGHLRSIPAVGVLAALALTALGYFVLTGYDVLALRYVGNPLPYRKVALVSFVAYVFSHNIGLSIFGGSAVRYRMLSGWDVKAEDIARVIAFTLMTFWMGFFLLGGVLHSLWPLPVAGTAGPLETSRPVGWVLLGATAASLVFVALRREPLRIHGFRVDLPLPRSLALQFTLSTIDWLVTAAVLYAVLPSAAGPSFPVFAGAYLLAQLAGLISNVPGGLGVFETAMVLLLKPWLAGDEVLASILVYRLVYFLIPLVVAVVLFAAYELRERRATLQRTGAWLQGWTAELAPRLLAVTTFLAGALMVFSGATPELPERLAWMRRTMPVPWIEVSKLLGSLIGVGLLLLANALRQRLDAGYLGALVLLLSGSVLSFARGFDWVEGGVLLGMALVLLPCRPFFYRKSSLLGQPLSRGWWLAVAAVALGALIALDLGYRQVQYSNELWWRFGGAAEAPRSLRALLLAGVALVAVGTLRLLRPAPPAPDPPTAEELDLAQAITVQQPTTRGYLALLRDKRLLFGARERAFLMYGVSGRTWVAMGDPVGPEEEQEELAWQFLELADRHGARAVFYAVSEDALPVYLDLGLDLRKLGEAGRVPLAEFSLEGGERKDLRQSQSRMIREGCSFEVVPAAAVPPLLDEIEAISDAWLAAKNTREKRFSLGYFDRDYLSRLPVALVRQEGRIVAFANVWPSDAKVELTVDLMRHADDAPRGVMEYIFTQLILWGREEGYRYFSMGMAPLSGFEHRRLAPLWNRFGATLFRHGEHFYNFQGLRAFKEKFNPRWEPRYLASPGGFTTPLVLTRIATLVAGGVTGVLSK